MQITRPPRRPEIDQYAVKFIIGAVALGLPLIEFDLTHGSITSLSASYWSTDGPWPRSVLVGLLFAIAALLLTYNGKSAVELWLTKLASVAALGVAMFPCECGDAANEILRGVHMASASVLFAILGVFCLIFMHRASEKGHREARWRAAIYAACSVGILGCLALFAAYALHRNDEVLILWGETLGLWSFGISWMTASRVLPFITTRSERQRLIGGPAVATGQSTARVAGSARNVAR